MWKNEYDIEIREKLSSHYDADYGKFNKKLISTSLVMNGVRIPIIRAFAKGIAKYDAIGFIESFKPMDYEETLLYGIVLAYSKLDILDNKHLLEQFIDKIDNWAINDSVAMSFKKSTPEIFDYLQSFINRGTWYTRFAVVYILADFVNEAYISQIFEMLKRINYGEYYVDMAVAWLISVAYVKFPRETYSLLSESTLPEFVMRKSVSKCNDSYRISKDDKLKLKKLLADKINLNKQ